MRHLTKKRAVPGKFPAVDLYSVVMNVCGISGHDFFQLAEYTTSDFVGETASGWRKSGRLDRPKVRLVCRKCGTIISAD